jgi:rubrerythrin
VSDHLTLHVPTGYEIDLLRDEIARLRDELDDLPGCQHWRENQDLMDEIARLRSILGDILAVIHRDGGHYTEEHGLERSARDATRRVSELREGLAEALRLLDSYEMWNCIACGADLEKGDPCDATCPVRRLRELAGVDRG